jgi:hypothetical protein
MKTMTTKAVMDSNVSTSAKTGVMTDPSIIVATHV